jgi:hypothetical protein
VVWSSVYGMTIFEAVVNLVSTSKKLIFKKGRLSL